LISTRDIMWLAGLLEGEGCFRWNVDTAHISLRMSDRDVVERAHRLLGATQGIVVQEPERKPGINSKRTMYRVQICGKRAMGWMMTLYPLMGERRRAKIRDVIATWRGRPVSNAAKTHCKRGHQLFGGNLRMRASNGQRTCRACEHAGNLRKRVEWNRRRRERRRVAA
jgi:hypothetical protein